MVVCVGEDNSEKYKQSGLHETRKSPALVSTFFVVVVVVILLALLLRPGLTLQLFG